MTAPTGSGPPNQYPYKTPRWILWVVGLVSVAAVIAAFIVGPNDGGSDKSSGSGPAATDSSDLSTALPPSTDGTTSTTTRPSTTTTTAAPTTRPPTTAPPTTAPPTTAAPTTPPPPPPPASATVAVNSCRVEAGSLIATGTLTNTGSSPRSFRAMAVATDRAGRNVIALAVEVDPVTPGATVPFTIRTNVDGPTSSQIAACRGDGATPL